nr:thiamine diphosphokinase [uncultured Blautia sp.]
MNDVIIVSGGSIQKDFALAFLKKRKQKNTCIIAADKGLEFLSGTEYSPDVVVGDFDSLSPEGKVYLDSLKNTEICRLKPEKDDSDTQSATNYAIARGAKQITILGATGNRIDHLLANFGLLVMAKNKGTVVDLVDAYNYITLIPSGTVLKKDMQFGKYVSFFSIGGDVTGLTLKGFKYPLNGHHLTTSDSGLTVSNEIKDEEAVVTYEKGTLLMLMTRD